MTARDRTPTVHIFDRAPAPTSIRDEVIGGLQRCPKELSPKLLYDQRGAQLFEQITELEEYYPTRSERSILQRHIDEIVELLGPRCLLIEYGSGSSAKTRLLLDHLPAPAGYIPIDISREQLVASASDLAAAYPGLELLPVVADYTTELELPEPSSAAGRRVVFFPGSTIGNFHPPEAEAFLRRIAAACGPGGGLLIGVDVKKDPLVLHAAYNDARGITAAFNLNVLEHINRELQADFNPARFRHYAFYHPVRGRIEMHLVSLVEQSVQIADTSISFARGESIWTESSYKYGPEEFLSLAAAAGFTPIRRWMDPAQLFSVHYLEVHSQGVVLV